MINEEIKFINDGYLYDQNEQKLYDVFGNIIIPELHSLYFEQNTLPCSEYDFQFVLEDNIYTPPVQH